MRKHHHGKKNSECDDARHQEPNLKLYRMALFDDVLSFGRALTTRETRRILCALENC